MFHELSSRDRGEGCATGQPQGVGSEAYLNSTSQGEPVLSLSKEHPRTPGFRLVEPTARREGWPYPWSQQVIHEISGLVYPGHGEVTNRGVLGSKPFDMEDLALRLKSAIRIGHLTDPADRLLTYMDELDANRPD